LKTRARRSILAFEILEPCVLRIVVHDYAGHPFQVDLSRELARRQHIVWHLYFAGDRGPKGAMGRLPDDPESFQVVPIDIGWDYSKSNFIRRRSSDALYGRAVAAQIEALGPDVVISGNTPLDAQGAIIEATHRAGGAFVNWIQDFYSLAIERLLARRWLGLGSLIAAYYRHLETQQLTRSDAVVLISEDFRQSLRGFEGRQDRIAIIPNWGAISAIPLRPKSNPWSQRNGFADRFVFLYSGTLGLKHNPDALVALSDAFVDCPEVCVVVAASGMGRDRLDAILSDQPRPNLFTLPLQSFSDFPDFLGAADVLVAVLDENAGEFSVPSKVLSYLCAGRPILLAAPLANPASRMMRETQAGRVVRPDDMSALIASARNLYLDGFARQRMAAAGRSYAEDRFVISRVADQFEGVFRATT
jgi:colanic acid biosynthesis glycosyl transferase WcaI